MIARDYLVHQREVMVTEADCGVPVCRDGEVYQFKKNGIAMRVNYYSHHNSQQNSRALLRLQLSLRSRIRIPMRMPTWKPLSLSMTNSMSSGTMQRR
jgi:hypothetical protein